MNCLYLCIFWKWVCKCVLEEVEHKYFFFFFKAAPHTNQICAPARTDTFGIEWSNQTQQQQTNQPCGQETAASAKTECWNETRLPYYGRVTGSNLLGSTACVTWKECSVAGAQTHTTAATVIIQVSIETTSASCIALEPQKPSGSNLSSQHNTYTIRTLKPHGDKPLSCSGNQM